LELENRLKGFDIAHVSESYFRFTQQALNAKKKGYVKKVVCTVFENIPFNNEGIWGRKVYKKRAIKEVDRFIAVTEGAKQVLVKEGVSVDRISVVPMSIDTKKFYPSKTKSTNRLRILFVGRIESFKGVFDALDAFEKVFKLHPNSEFLILGSGSKEQELKDIVEKKKLRKVVTITKSDYSKLPEIYRSCDIFIGPSKKDRYWKEQFGMVFLEAMASGLPIISYDSGSIREVVGSTGLLSRENDLKSLSSDLERLVSSPKMRVELGKKARKRAVSKFSVNVVANRIDRVYRRL
jgi:glycosyltransferase involved in cell wall biosynthesis